MVKQVLILSEMLVEECSSAQPIVDTFDGVTEIESASRRSSQTFDNPPQKNTFIHFDVPAGLSDTDRPPTPTASAPGIMLKRLFKTKADAASDASTRSSSSDSILSAGNIPGAAPTKAGVYGSVGVSIEAVPDDGEWDTIVGDKTDGALHALLQAAPWARRDSDASTTYSVAPRGDSMDSMSSSLSLLADSIAAYSPTSKWADIEPDAEHGHGEPSLPQAVVAQMNEITNNVVKLVTSNESALESHRLGTCTPCNYFWYKVDGCRNEACTFCHLCPKGEIKKRKKDKLRQLRKAGLLVWR